MDRKRLLVDVEQVVGWFKPGEEVDEARVKVGIETLAGAVLGLLQEEVPPGASITRARWEVEAALSKVGKIQGGPADTATGQLLVAREELARAAAIGKPAALPIDEAEALEEVGVALAHAHAACRPGVLASEMGDKLAQIGAAVAELRLAMGRSSVPVAGEMALAMPDGTVVARIGRASFYGEGTITEILGRWVDAQRAHAARSVTGRDAADLDRLAAIVAGALKDAAGAAWKRVEELAKAPAVKP